MIVLDSSATIELLIDREHGAWVLQQLTHDADAHAPHLIDIEVVSGLRGLLLGGKVSQPQAELALDDFAELPVRRYPHTLLLERVWQLHKRVSPYDAVYVALAEALDAPLITTDLRLARTHGHRARIVAPE